MHAGGTKMSAIASAATSSPSRFAFSEFLGDAAGALAPHLLGFALNIGVSHTPHTHMSVSKKTTSKSAKTPAPASKSAAAKSVTKQTNTAATVQSTAKTPVAMLAPSPTVPVAPAKSVTTAPVLTTITARIDVGFGNALFVRGEGPGLSWEKGLAMECVDGNLWRITLAESARAYTFKFLINDVTWSAGPDFTAACGTNVTVTPEF